MNLDTVEKRMPEWYSSRVDIASHTDRHEPLVRGGDCD